MSSRRKIRELAVKSLYNADFYNLNSDSVEFFPAMNEEEIEKLGLEAISSVTLNVQGTLEKKSEIDAIINEFSKNRKVEKIDPVDRAILRLSIFMMVFQRSLAPAIIIDEAVKMSLEFGSNTNYKFINGLLDTIRKDKL